jgi:hypothetical protein
MVTVASLHLCFAFLNVNECNRILRQLPSSSRVIRMTLHARFSIGGVRAKHASRTFPNIAPEITLKVRRGAFMF